MSDEKVESPEVLDEDDPNYKPPAQKSINEILEADKEDESLRRYKEALLGGAVSGSIVAEPSDPRRVIVKKLALMVEGMPDKQLELDLTGDLAKLKETKFKIKEGVQYKIRIDFVVQREIVHGLKYVQKTKRKGIFKEDVMTHMVGSYAPKQEVQSYTTPLEEAPSGILFRGEYTVTSLFTDDDKNVHLKWEWKFKISDNWWSPFSFLLK